MRYIIFSLSLISFSTLAQKNINATHTIFIEALGAGGYYSVNYDKILFVTDKAVYSIRIGTSIYYEYVNYYGPMKYVVNRNFFNYAFPLTINRWNARDMKHHFELGGGLTIALVDYDWNPVTQTVSRKIGWGPTGFVGYRYQKPEGGLMIRAGWIPLYDIAEDLFFPYWAGVGIGYTFKPRHKELEQSNKKTDFTYSQDNPDTHFPIPISKSSKDSALDTKWSDSTLWRKSNTFFLGAGGISALSPNYDKIFFVKRSLKLSVRAGFSLQKGNYHNEKRTFVYILPMGFNAFLGRGKHHFQAGMGEVYINAYEYPEGNITIQSEPENIDIFTTYLFFGYRYQKPTGGLFIQAGWVPAILRIKNHKVAGLGNPGAVNPLLIDIGLGYSFLPKEFGKQKK